MIIDGKVCFPGYTYDHGKSSYKGEDPGEGGCVRSVPGMYTNVALLDIASMHPHSITAMNMFGTEYTRRFEDILDARIYIKHQDFESARMMLGGKLAPYLTDPAQAKALSKALKIPINSVYGLTAAKFDNKFHDKRNIDNTVAKRGALFMLDLREEIEARGYTVAHIKTDSVKIPEADDDIIEFIMDYGKQYGYQFEHEATYSKLCLVNDAVYIAKGRDDSPEDAGRWTATGAQFAVPYVFKTLFSHEPIELSDMTETKSVTGDASIYLDMNEDLPDVTALETELDKRRRHLKRLNPDFSAYSDDKLREEIAKGHNYVFIGKVGSFVPIQSGHGGGILYRDKYDPNTGETKYYAISGSKGYRWLETEVAKIQDKTQFIDKSYFTSLVDDAVANISQYGDFEWFVSD